MSLRKMLLNFFFNNKRKWGLLWVLNNFKVHPSPSFLGYWHGSNIPAQGDKHHLYLGEKGLSSSCRCA
jgi:hypothetical protein